MKYMNKVNAHHNARHLNIIDAADSMMHYILLDPAKTSMAIINHINRFKLSKEEIRNFYINLSRIKRFLKNRLSLSDNFSLNQSATKKEEKTLNKEVLNG